MKKALLNDLVTFLSVSSQGIASPDWECERQRLLAEILRARDAIPVYQSRIFYKLEWRKDTVEIVDGKEKRGWTSHTLGRRTEHKKKMREHVLNALQKYPMEELRLHHGSKPIKDILAWLDEPE
jgi:hypothetical protein